MDLVRKTVATLFIAVLVAIVGSCHSDTVVGVGDHDFQLRAIFSNAGERLAVPATLTSATPGDEVQILGGRFELQNSGQWSMEYRRVVLAQSVPQDHRTLGAAGTYRVVSEANAGVQLDLYPGQLVPGIVTPVAIIRGDTLFYHPFAFVK